MKNNSNNNYLWDIEVSLTHPHFKVSAKMQSSSSTIGIVGASGSGKSTLLRILAGLEKKSFGKIVFGDKIWQSNSSKDFTPPWKRCIGYVPQDILLIPTLSVLENLRFSGVDENNAKKIAEKLSIEHLLERRPRMLSGGEKQRVAIGRALLSSPKLLLLDEPFSALDKNLRAQVAELLTTICFEKNIPLILISHYENDILSFTKEIWEIENGCLNRTI